MELTSDKDRIVFADLESYVRERAQAFIQSVLEEEVDELLGRDRHMRRDLDSPAGNRNGHAHGPRCDDRRSSGSRQPMQRRQFSRFKVNWTWR